MQTSEQGIAALTLEEGEVLRAYRDTVGVWTIGVGLTAASGVVKPKAGMVITKAESSALLAAALRANYEPAVEVAMSNIFGNKVLRPAQNEFDAGVSFHFNSGAINKASWVKSWLNNAPHQVTWKLFLKWNKGGGKVLPSLTARRQREADMLLDGIYREATGKTKPGLTFATWGLPLLESEITAIRDGFAKVGYNVGDRPDAIRLAAAMKFQSDHGLTVDGIIGRATLSTLQRALDARTKTKAPAAASLVTVGASASSLTDQIASMPWAMPAVSILLILWGLSLAVRYRDIIAAQINRPLPRLAAFLRSF